jgi:hypothetical protein
MTARGTRPDLSMDEAQVCAKCGATALDRCDQCGAGVCATHRKVITTELGSWSRCPRCDLRNHIRESPFIRWMRIRHEVGMFIDLVWLLVAGVVVMILVLAWALGARLH